MIFRSPWPDIALPQLSVGEAVLCAARQYGEKTAIVEGETGQALSYPQLVQGAERVAAGLAEAGLRPGQAIALALPNSIDFVLAWYGALLTGAFVVPINPLYTPTEMKSLIANAGARFLITFAECAVRMEECVERLFVTGGNWNAILQCHGRQSYLRSGLADLAALPCSSGTTGKPKGVMLTHANIMANMEQIRSIQWVRHDDICINIFPLYHAAGLNAMLNVFMLAGATLVLMRRFELQFYLELAERYTATFLAGPPPVIHALTKSPLRAGFDFNNFRTAVCGAAPLGAELHEAFEQRTEVLLGQVWGMTEASVMVTATPNERKMRKFGSCGYLLPSCEAQILDLDSQKPVGVGKAGEIAIRGPNIMKGYWNNAAADSETFCADGWMRTGDIGYFDADQCVFLVDRLKELIKYNAQQVAPAELEDIIQSHPAVFDVAVIGVPDADAGEIPKAFIVRKKGATVDAEELMRFVAARVAPHKKIRAVEFIQEIPKTPSGKILRRILKEKAVPSIN